MDTPLSEIWEKTLDILGSELSEATFDAWIKSTYLVSAKDKKMIVCVPNEFAKDWLESRYYNLIKNTLQLIVNQEIELLFYLPYEVEKLLKGNKEHSLSDDCLHTTNDASLLSYLNPKYTFDSFVIGNSNRFAHAASLAVAETPAKSYNPLFIYGGVGLGKTHLMHAIGHMVHILHPELIILYVSSETFTNELIKSIRDDKTVEFRNKYRNIDVLLIDDIQFLAGKERTQEEFFHTFNSLHEANKQIIISSDRPPKEIPTLEDRLRSRFEWGLITDIQPPDLETRIAILSKKAKLENLKLPDEVLLFIAKKIKSNIRELEGALIRVSAHASFIGKELDYELAEESLQKLFSLDNTPKISVAFIQQTVAQYFNVKVADLKGKKRNRKFSYPRQVAMYLSRQHTEHSLAKIGDEFGGKDHTTVLHACDKISKELKSDLETQLCLNKIKELMNV